MAQMLRHKETGELFIYTDLYSKMPELELVVEDPVKAVIAEVTAQNLEADDLEALLAKDTPVVTPKGAVSKHKGK